MKLVIDIPDEYYKSIKNTAIFISGQRSGKSFINHLCNAVANGIPQETVTEFADRCRECGKMRTGHWIRITNGGAMKQIYLCSVCHRQIEDDGIEALITIKYPYCHCGVRMIEERNEK